MSGIWFSNRGQMIQVASAVISAVLTAMGVLIALSVQYPDIFKLGVNGVSAGWPLIAIPAGLALFGSLIPNLLFPVLDRIARRSFEKRFPEFRSSDEKPPVAQATPATTPVPAVEVKKPKPEEFEIRDATRPNSGSILAPIGRASLGQKLCALRCSVSMVRLASNWLICHLTVMAACSTAAKK
jgi:hypothetical protein